MQQFSKKNSVEPFVHFKRYLELLFIFELNSKFDNTRQVFFSSINLKEFFSRSRHVAKGAVRGTPTNQNSFTQRLL